LFRVGTDEAHEGHRIEVRHLLNLLFCPIFLGHSKASGCFMGGEPNGVEGGAGKAEAAKLPGAGISPKQCPRK
jgi:hypothetical protein